MPENIDFGFLAALDGGSRTIGYVPAAGGQQEWRDDRDGIRPRSAQRERPSCAKARPRYHCQVAALSRCAGSFLPPTGESARNVAGKALLSKLDLRTFPSSQNMLSDDGSHTLAALYPDDASSDATTARIDTEDWSLTLEVVVAAAHLNDNEAEDWIVWLIDESKTGDYRNYQTLLIYDPSDQHDRLAARAYPGQH